MVDFFGGVCQLHSEYGHIPSPNSIEEILIILGSCTLKIQPHARSRRQGHEVVPS